MNKVICIKNTIELGDNDILVSDLVNVGEIYILDSISKPINDFSVYIYSNTTNDIWSCPSEFFMDLDEWRTQQINKIFE